MNNEAVNSIEDNMAFELRDVAWEEVEDAGPMAFFTVMTEKGEVRLAEHITINDFDVDVETTDSNVLLNCVDELASVFDISNKPSFMPIKDCLPYDVIAEKVETVLMLIDKDKEALEYFQLMGCPTLTDAPEFAQSERSNKDAPVTWIGETDFTAEEYAMLTLGSDVYHRVFGLPQ